jgi:hypothetical protein
MAGVLAHAVEHQLPAWQLRQYQAATRHDRITAVMSKAR